MGRRAGAAADRPVLIYDGDCAFCTSCVRFIEGRIPVRAELLPYQFADLDALGTTPGRAAREVLWVAPDGRVHGGADAIGRLLMSAHGLWRPAGALLLIPPFHWITRSVYRLVARNRHRLPGGTAACALPPERRPGGPGPGLVQDPGLGQDRG